MNPAAARLLRAIASAMRSYSLYPKGHPVRQESLDGLEAAVGSFPAGDLESESMDLIIHEDSFFFENRLLSKESIVLQWMMRRWQERGVDSISIQPGASRDDMLSLLDYLTGEGPEPTGGISVNSAQLAAREEAPVRANALRSLYARAIDLTRDIGIGVARGASPPLGAAEETVERLVDGVLVEPESALLLATMHSHDEYTFFHSVNVCILSVATGAAIGMEREQLATLGMGGLLHDIGKVGIPTEILNRSGSLTEDDWAQIRRHPLEGTNLLVRSWRRISPLAAVVAFEHHLHIDGTGYPAGPVHEGGTDLLSRIVTVADTFDAMTSRRPYRRAEQRQRALDVLLSGSGSHYDPRIVRVFVRMLGFFPPGSVVRLDDSSVAVVVRNNQRALDRPVVKVVRGPGGEPVDPFELDLAGPGRVPSVAGGVDGERAGIDPADLVQ